MEEDDPKNYDLAENWHMQIAIAQVLNVSLGLRESGYKQKRPQVMAKTPIKLS